MGLIPARLSAGQRWFRVCLELCAITALLTQTGRAQQAESAPSNPGTSAPAQSFVIPDGTPVPLRFAQPLRGRVPCLWKANCELLRLSPAKVGDTVRMVAASDVRVGPLVVIAKGARGQASVTKVFHPFMALTGLAIRFDWIEDVTGKHVPLRLEKTGKAEPFTIQILSTPGGMMGRKETLRGDLAGKDAVDVSLLWHKKNWIPAGTRIKSFTQGETARDLAEITDAQALLPVSTDVATLTVYRTKGDHEVHLHVTCDGSDFGVVEAQQYLVTELAPGKHSCQAEHEASLEIAANAGEDYFVRLLSSTPGLWELKLMDAGEGEDTIATLTPAGKAAQENGP